MQAKEGIVHFYEKSTLFPIQLTNLRNILLAPEEKTLMITGWLLAHCVFGIQVCYKHLDFIQIYVCQSVSNSVQSAPVNKERPLLR